ncbi:hypothetical protein [Marinobacter salarius]|uniref:Uncharacterized protein n=1 Tax=Marinobacter salarius TaxID=1420917 RepID=A0A1W6KFF2_9GAMM|nr:hypothetical protein [Marinobacter salarius]ARM86140.1 hypothetical protein MARSALSMR5_04120 [Marinobacter salarius]
MTTPARLLDLKVLYVPHPCPILASEDWALVILGRLLDEGEAMDQSRWTFLFIGSVEDLHQQFTAYAARQFDQRLWLTAQGRSCAAGEFLRTLNHAIDRRTPLGAQTLLRCGIRTLSWNHQEVEAGSIDLEALSECEGILGGIRYGVTITTDADALLMIDTALRIKRESKQLSKSRSRCGLPMIEKSQPGLTSNRSPENACG